MRKYYRIAGILILLIGCIGIAVSLWKTPDYIQENQEEPAQEVIAADSDTEEADITSEKDTEEPEVTPESEMPQETREDDSDRALEILQQMTLEEKVYQMFIVTQESLTGVAQVTQSGETTKNAIESYPVGGIIYFSPNLISRDQCKNMIDNIQNYSKTELFIAVDEEGGIVSRLGKNAAMGITDFPSMGTIGAAGDLEKAQNVGFTIGSEIKELGFNLNFAPVADVWSNPENTVIGSRAFGSDPQMTADMVAACVQGFSESGMLCTLKHFPGHGDTALDSHYGKVTSDKNEEELFECELKPFQSGIQAGAPLVMIGHITLPNYTGEEIPATFSEKIVTGLLREQLEFDGIIITDSMSMQAVTEMYTSGEAAVKAVQAGVDIILMPADFKEAASGILTAVEDGSITEERINESVLRILKLKLENGIISQ